ncbi:hypothetical protein Tco_0242668 [Tanacetum coccineum]
MMHQLPLEPLRQEAFKDLVMNFVLDQEERVKQLEECMGVIGGNYFVVSRRPIHPGDVIDWDLFATHGLAREFFKSINTDAFTGPQWANLFQINEPVYRELVWEFFTSFEFDSIPCSARSGLNRGETVRAKLVTIGFWLNIGDGDFVMGETIVKKVRDPKVRLAHRCIATTISGRKKSTHWVTTIDLFFLYCIYGEGVTCNIPYWLAWYLESVRDKDLTCEGMFVTRITRSFGLLTDVMRDALSVEPKAHIFKKKSLIAMNVLMDRGRGNYYWPATLAIGENDEVEEAVNKEAGDSANMYRNMSQGDWQVRQARWMDQ